MLLASQCNLGMVANALRVAWRHGGMTKGGVCVDAGSEWRRSIAPCGCAEQATSTGVGLTLVKLHQRQTHWAAAEDRELPHDRLTS